MARPREFEETAVLDRALQVFWKFGYDECPISELVRATGLKRQSLYNAFVDKNGLFLAVVKRYSALVEQSLAPLDAPNAGLPEIRSYIEDFLRIQRSGPFGACLLVKASYGQGMRDPRVRTVVESSAEQVRRRFSLIARRAQKSGDLSVSTDPEAFANYWFAVLHGLSALASTGGSDSQVKSALSWAFESEKRKSGEIQKHV